MSHSKGLPIRGDFCLTYLQYLVSCSDAEIERCLPLIPAYDLNRLRRLVARPVRTAETLPDPGHEKAS